MSKKAQSFRFYAEIVLSLKESKAKNTRNQAIAIINKHLIPFFGKYKISEITQFQVMRYLNEKSKTRKTYDHCKHLKSIFKCARMHGEKLKELEVKSLDIGVGRSKVYTDKEVASMLRACIKCGLLDMHLQIRMAYHMGMRRGECTKIQWSMIDLDNGWIYLPPWFMKTRRREDRDFAINNSVLMDLRKRKKTATSERVFRVTDTRKQFKRVQRVAGVTGRFHDLRHTCATRMLNAGIPEKVICKMLGMSPDVLRRYAHVIPEIAKRAVNL